ncbi:MAG: site-specific integrase [Carboxylicivirga sp.]|jgi:hypothetical protein|nr:site-specific integrase [Carboxylicivirga sp.]
MDSTPTFGLQFVARQKSKISELTGIYLRITVNRQRVEISTKLKCPKRLWDAMKESVKSDSKFNHRHVNKHINEIRLSVQSIYQELRNSKQLITARIIKNKYNGISDGDYTLKNLMQLHLEKYSKVYEYNTIKLYKTTHRYICAYLNDFKKVDDIFLAQIDYRFISDFEIFLRSYQPEDLKTRTLSHNTVMKHLARLRSLINFAIKLEWMKNYPFKAYTLSYKPSVRKYLTKEELYSIIQTSFEIKRLNFVKDIFVFACYTGLAYSDVERLTEANIVKGIDGGNRIYTQRKKTDNPVRIPLLNFAEQLVFEI